MIATSWTRGSQNEQQTINEKVQNETCKTRPKGPRGLNSLHEVEPHPQRNQSHLSGSIQSGDSGHELLRGWEPTIDVYEDKDKLTVKAELPGMKKEDIAVSLEGSTLTVSGERKQEQERKEGETYRSERFFGRFQQSITLSQQVDPKKIQANYKDGVLTITLPKSEEAKRKQIEIKTS